MNRQLFYILIIVLLHSKLCSSNSGRIYTTFQTPYEDYDDYGRFAGSWPTQNQYPRLVGDFDGDGISDIIGFGASVSVAYGNGSGYSSTRENVSNSFVFGSTDFDYTSFDDYPRLVGDVDGDGMDDIIGFETDGVYVSYSQGRGQQFTAKAKKFGGFKKALWTSFNTYPRFAAYVDNDNMIDVVGFYDGGVHVIYGNGRDDFSVIDGTNKLPDQFDVASGYLDQGDYPRQVADIDGDGLADLIGFGETMVQVSFQKSDRTFENPVDLLSNNEYTYEASFRANTPRMVFDVNGDGKADLVAFANSRIIISLSKGKEKATGDYDGLSNDFVFTHGWPNYDQYPRTLGDVNGDGLLDVIGFDDRGLKLALGQKQRCNYERSNTDRSRDIDNDCACKPTYFDKGDSLECGSCTSPCKNCSGSATNCTECINTTNRELDNTCRCSDGYYDDANYDCQLCPNSYKVAKCSDVSTITECKNGLERSLNTADCGCNPGYYDDGSNLACVICKYPCINCTSDTVCVGTCQTPSNRNSAPTCGCMATFYDNDTECTSCSHPCLNCNSETECTTCASVPNRNQDSTCSCHATYYDDGSDCMKCPKPCNECSSVSICTSCLGNFRQNTSICECQDGYYHINGQDDCEICPNSYKVAKCTNSSTITECKPGFERSLNIADCGCNPGFYDDGSNLACVACKYPCVNCTSDTVCVGTCQTPTNRNNAPTCDCMDTFYDNDSECISCSHPCENCNSETECTSCASVPNRNQDSTCSCHARFYDDGSDCVPCNKPCDECSSDTVCVSCVGNFRKAVTLSLTNCECSDGYYDNNIGDDCQLCPNSYKVAKCSISSVIECKPGFQRSMDSSTGCGCNDGYFDDGINIGCVKCDYPCINCSSQGVCVGTCQTPSNRNSSPTCDCQDGYFENGTECQQCDHTLCVTCQNSANECIQFCEEGCALCDNQNRCLESENKYFVVADGSVEKCDRQCLSCENQADNCLIQCDLSCALCNQQGSCETCKIGDYLTSQNACEVCHPKCYSCQNSNSQCTQCTLSGIGRSFDIDTNCGCKRGYYEDENNLDCIKCSPSSCSQCDSDGTCTQCQNEDLLPPLCQFSKTAQFVIDGQNSSLVSACEPKCNKCENSADNCTECQLGQNRSQDLPCKCLEGYHDNRSLSKDCLPCPKYCSSCESEDMCLQCYGLNRILNRFTNKCECEQGYKENKLSGVCEMCFMFNGECISQCPLNTVLNKEVQTCEYIQYQAQNYQEVVLVWSGLFVLVMVALSIFVFIVFRKSKYTQFLGSQSQQKRKQNIMNQIQ